MNKNLLDILGCPVCKGRVDYVKKAAEIVCPRCYLAYPIVDDIPVMLQDKARELSADEIEKLQA